MAYPKIVEQLIERMTKLPGIGRRSAERIVFWLLDRPREEVQALCDDMINLKDHLKFCRVCNNLSETEICMICSATNRHEGLVCVVENPKDVLAIEKTGQYRGSYHVLLGAINPSEGRGPECLRVGQLFQRIKAEGISEVIIATDADTEGEMTALYLTQELKPLGVKISRIGVGIPMGSALEYIDISTLSASLNARREI